MVFLGLAAAGDQWNNIAAGVAAPVPESIFLTFNVMFFGGLVIEAFRLFFTRLIYCWACFRMNTQVLSRH